ncbi:hypothetical protein FH972_023385 [Carpinus fangiana]|uniref:Uncharacterized protein n=1 Tax=Carpinus fangiana TaxID=176857 RepID=A0A5N6KV22_9ROSI|nr:hypothetical protein FH972_023385 [Carpinus fangiana]
MTERRGILGVSTVCDFTGPNDPKNTVRPMQRAKGEIIPKSTYNITHKQSHARGMQGLVLRRFNPHYGSNKSDGEKIVFDTWRFSLRRGKIGPNDARKSRKHSLYRVKVQGEECITFDRHR